MKRWFRRLGARLGAADDADQLEYSQQAARDVSLWHLLMAWLDRP